MRLFLISFLGVFIFLSCGEDSGQKNLVEEGEVFESDIPDTCDCDLLAVDSLQVYTKDGLNYSGVCISYYPNTDSKYVEKNLLEGLLHGSVKYFSKDGSILIEEIYKNGSAKRSGSADAITCNCEELVQMDSSDPAKAVKYSLDDIPFSGKCHSYYPESDQIYMEAIYEDGYLDGYSTFFNKDGSKLYMEVYTRGVLDRTVY